MKKILVVDDSPLVREQVQAALAGTRFEVIEAIDGMDAIAKLDPSIALVICDVNMPRMDGIETVERVRSDARWSALPVIMLTTEGQPSMIERARKLGASGWIIKPFKQSVLLAAVQRLTAAS